MRHVCLFYPFTSCEQVEILHIRPTMHALRTCPFDHLITQLYPRLLRRECPWSVQGIHYLTACKLIKTLESCTSHDTSPRRSLGRDTRDHDLSDLLLFICRFCTHASGGLRVENFTATGQARSLPTCEKCK